MTSVAVRMFMALVLVAGVAVANPDSASAVPDETTVRKKVQALGEKVEKVSEKYYKAKRALASSKRQVKSLTDRASDQAGEVKRLRSAVSGMAASTYIGGATDVASLVDAKTPQDLVDRATSLEQIAAQDERRINLYRDAAKELTAKRESASKATKKQKKLTDKLKKQKATITSALAEQKQLLDRVTADSEPASRGDRGTNVDLPPASGRAAAVLEFARAQLGKPYAWGAEGPDSYDCSGLTLAAWKRGGVSLPHSSQAQQSSGPSVPKSQLQPGDLVFFGSPVHHVGLYAGGNKMIHAPNSGENVQVTSLSESYWQSNYVGAARPG